MLIKTTRIDKREEYCKINLLKPFLQMVRFENAGPNVPPNLSIDPDFYSLRVDYRFVSSLGETFEAELSLG